MGKTWSRKVKKNKLINFSHTINATKYSLYGLKAAFKNEQAFKHEVFILVFLFLILLIFDKSFFESVVVISAWLLVMAVELLNSAIEEAFDMITLEKDERVKRGKDMASAAIFICIVINILIWLYVFF